MNFLVEAQPHGHSNSFGTQEVDVVDVGQVKTKLDEQENALDRDDA
jgi:hypothetical protein